MASTINANTTTGLVSNADTSGQLELQTANTTALTITSSQNVGVGTTTPLGTTSNRTVLTVNGVSSSLVNLGVNNSETFRLASDGSAIYVQGRTSVPMQFYTNDTERMRIDSSGNLLVGTTSSIGGLLQVNQTANSSGANFQCTNASFTTQVIQAITTKAAGTDFTLFRGVVNNAGTVVYNVFGNGNVTNTNGSYAAISDVKLKENIVDATPKLDDLMQVKVRNYNLKSDPTFKQIGVVAQELEQVFPSLVEEIKDSDVEGNDLGTTTKSVKYSIFIPMLIKAVQELKAELDATKAEVAALKGAK